MTVTFIILLIVIMLSVIALAEPLGERIGVVAPVLLLVLSAAVAFVPQVPEVVIDPEIILELILPPLLFATAMRMPVHDFRRNFSSIFLLAVVLVVLTAVSVGWVIHLIVPAIPLPIAIAVGAVVSPSDAVAVGIVKKAGVNRRIIAILDGEGLINDASALVTLGTALLAARSKVTAGEVLANFFWAVAGAVIVGLLVGHGAMFLRRFVHHPTSNTVLSLAIPFAAFLPTEEIGASGLVGTVVAGLVVPRKSVGVLGPSVRMSDAQTWDTLGLVLESLVFVLMGLQMPHLIDDARASGYTFMMSFTVAMACWVTVLVVRTLTVTPMMYVMRSQAERTLKRMERLDVLDSRIQEVSADPRMQDERAQRRLSSAQQTVSRRYGDARYFAEKSLGFRAGSVIVWAGMRGAITLAAAQTLPHDTEGRGFLVLVAFIVAGASLIVQGGTLGLLVDVVNPGQDEPSSWEERQRQRTLLRDAATAVPVPADLERALRYGGLSEEKIHAAKVEDLLGVLRNPHGFSAAADEEEEVDLKAIPQQLADYGIARVKAQREALVADRDAGRIDADDFSYQLRRLDGAQLSIEAQSESFLRTGIMGGNEPAREEEEVSG